ncbi:MAG: ferrous iron transporter B [Actinomycetes bacterium]
MSRPRVALVGSPNAGKTTLFNALTGLRAKTGNYPGVTVARRVGIARVDGREVLVEDLPGTYSLEPVSPDEQVVADVLAGRVEGVEAPQSLIVVADATTIERSMILIAQVLELRRPTCLVVTMVDELKERNGNLDIPLLARALGIPVVAVVGTKHIGMQAVRDLLVHPANWPVPPLPPPVGMERRAAWISSILEGVLHANPHEHRWTERLDRVLLHPVWGSIVFFVVMVVFFQVIFSWAVPLQDLIGAGFDALGGWVQQNVQNELLAGLLGQAVIGGVGTVLQFLPQIMGLFLMISLLENVGYMSRAALVMDRAMGTIGLEGRCFVSMLSSYACAVPGIMSTRTIPSSRNRLATILVAPLMTCSARLPIYTLLIAAFVPNNTVFGPLHLQGLVLFGLYLLGTASALLIAALLKKTALRADPLPFYMEMPPYRVPGAKLVVLQVWDSAKYFLRKAGTIILGATIVLWVLLHVPMVSAPPGLSVQQQGSYQMEHSVAGDLGRAVEPVFAPLGFNWQINVALISSLASREVFVSTLGQISAETTTADLSATMTTEVDPVTGKPVFGPGTVAAILIFFVFALQCVSTIAVMRRETNSWKWPILAFCYMFALAWLGGFIAYNVANAIVS